MSSGRNQNGLVLGFSGAPTFTSERIENLRRAMGRGQQANQGGKLRLLCFFGLHKWGSWIESIENTAPGIFEGTGEMTRRCCRCSRSQAKDISCLNF